ncbi:MAG: STAS domain-containing protein [Anaerolineae bacterium]|nr:STAS domain-containing protein [Anaerolineae bacterium]
MEITVKQAQGRVPVTILQTHGDLDASSFQALISKGKEVYDAGARNILLDMSDTAFMGSSGLAALHSLALLIRGDELPDLEAGWNVFHGIDRDRGSGLQQHLKLFNPQPQIQKVLEMSGLTQFFEIHTDLDAAIASF